MINVPKGLAPHEVDLYISAFKFCEKLIQEQNTDIGAAVTETTEKYSFIISDKELFAQFLFREITAYTEPSIGAVSPELDDKTWWSKLKKSEKFIPEYWQRYYDYLNRKPSWSLTAVQDIDSSTDEIMNALANPRSGSPCAFPWCLSMRYPAARNTTRTSSCARAARSRGKRPARSHARA